MIVINRSGQAEPMDLEKIILRIKFLVNYLKPLFAIDVNALAIETIKNVYDGVSTKELDDVTCRVALNKYILHEDYGKLAARIGINNYLKNIAHTLGTHITGPEFILATVHRISHVLAPHISKSFILHAQELGSILTESANYRYTYRGFSMLLKGKYLIDNIETPDFATLRIAVAIVAGAEILHDVGAVRELHAALSSGRFTFATPTLLNAGTNNAQYSSCVLIDVSDSLVDIGNRISTSMLYQKYSAGIGISFSKLRCRGAKIAGTNGIASGIAPLAQVFDKLGYYVDQGGGKRPGSISPYICDYHPDLLETLELRSVKNVEQAKDHHRLYYAVWVSDLFMKKTAARQEWYFICPSDGPKLIDLFGDEFETEYERLVSEKKYIRSMPALEVWEAIIRVQANAGVPYVVCKDTVNRMRNQNAMIYSSNLCAEITLPTNDAEVGVCNLASVSVRKFLTKKIEKAGNHHLAFGSYYLALSELEKTVRGLVRWMDRIIDINFYPVRDGEDSNRARRPLGIGIMGLADGLCKIGLPFGSPEACQFRAYFQEALYYYALDESIRLAEKYGPHAEFSQHKTASGNLHPLLFEKIYGHKYKRHFDWSELASRAQKGVRHSVLTACMPTGSTAMIMGNSPCFEPYESNIYRFSAHAEELVVVNKYLRRDLVLNGLSNKRFLNRLIGCSGRLADLNFAALADESHREFYRSKEGLEREAQIKKLYRVAAFEISPREIIDMAVAAAPYVDQSQSMNLFVPQLSINYFNHLYYGWKNGLKTLVYYTRSASSVKEVPCNNCVI